MTETAAPTGPPSVGDKAAPAPPAPPELEDAPSAPPRLTVRRAGPQVVIEGAGFIPGEALSVSLETDGQELGQPPLFASSVGAFTVYGRADPNAAAVALVRRASGELVHTRPPAGDEDEAFS